MEFCVLLPENLILPIWPWPNDLDTQTWPGHGEDVLPYQNEVSMSRHPKGIAWTETHTDWQHYLPTYMGGKYQCNEE